MNIQDSLKRGTIEMILMTILSIKDKYGYQIAQDIEKQSHGGYQLNEATMYPTLYRLKKNGYLTDEKVTVTGKRARVYYHLTDSGRAYLEDLQREYQKMSSSIQNILDCYSDPS